MKIAICAIIKNENVYLREWVEYHRGLGFDKIIIYDNNSIDGEVPHQVIGDYVMSEFVDVINVRGYEWGNVDGRLQPRVYNDCIKTYKNNYSWIAFIDVDEFITIDEKEPQNIHNLFEKYGYDARGFEQLVMSWYLIGDDDKLNYEDKPVTQRFTKHRPYKDIFDGISEAWVKSMVRTDTVKDGEVGVHFTQNKYTCDAYCRWVQPSNDGFLAQLSDPLHDIIYIRHYFSKSLCEHLAKQRNLKSSTTSDNRMSSYKTINGWNDEKEKVYKTFVEYINSPKKIQD